MRRFNLLRNPAIGVDLGSRTIKGVRLRKKKNQVFLDRYFFHDLASSSRGFPEQANLLETLRANIEMCQLSNAQAAVNLKDEDVFNFNLSLPRMKDSEMRCAVSHEIQENISIPIDELSFDYLLANCANAAPGDSIRVKAYCARRDAVTDRMKVLKASRLKLCAAESGILAIQAMLEFNEYLGPGKNYAIFDIGESHISTALVSDKDLVCSKSGRIGSGDINRALMDGLSLDYLEGERIKLSHDFDQRATEDTPCGKIVDDVYFHVFREIKETLEYFRENLSQQRRIDQILLTGGGSRTKNIDKVFELLFKVPTLVVNPFRNIQIYGESAAAQDEKIALLGGFMAAAVGLGLREIA